MEVTYTLPYTYMSGQDHSASLSVGHRCLGTQVPDRGLAEVLTSPNKLSSAARLASESDSSLVWFFGIRAAAFTYTLASALLSCIRRAAFTATRARLVGFLIYSCSRSTRFNTASASFRISSRLALDSTAKGWSMTGTTGVPLCPYPKGSAFAGCMVAGSPVLSMHAEMSSLSSFSANMQIIFPVFANEVGRADCKQ